MELKQISKQTAKSLQYEVCINW